MTDARFGDGAALTVRVPATPPRELWPNARVSWRAKIGPTRALRTMACHAAREALGPFGVREARARLLLRPTGPIRLDLLIAWPPGQRRLDDDSAIAAVKAVRDGLADALECDDRRFRQGAMTQTWDRDGDGYVVIELWREEAA